MASFAVIFPAAGRSTRFRRQQRKKPFVELRGRPVWVRAAEAFVNRDDVKQSLVVVSADDEEWFREKFRPNLAFMDIEIVAGGEERADSVERALSRIRTDIDFVAVHDAARPLMVKKWVDEIFAAAVEHGAAMPAIPVTETLKRVNDQQTIVETVDRSALWRAQTPQVVRRDLLLEAYAKRGDFRATDDAQLVERLGHPVAIVPGSAMNLKITTSEDFRIAEALVEALPKDRGLRPIHPFADEPPAGLF